MNEDLVVSRLIELISREALTSFSFLLITEYDWPRSYVYVPWPVDKLTRDVVSKDRVSEI